MKHDELRSIGHNIADSLASGIGLLVGVYDMDVFGEAGRSPEGFITVDFLNGTAVGGRHSVSLAKAIGLYREALPELCERHGVSVSSFRELTARYSIDALGRQVIVVVEDKNGRRSTDKYVGTPLRYVKTVDSLGRVRTKRN
jgi:hypothetical protein